MEFNGMPSKAQFKIYNNVIERLEEIEQTEKFEPMTILIKVIKEETRKVETQDCKDYIGMIYPDRMCCECGCTSFKPLK